jgi:hypothetical protein
MDKDNKLQLNFNVEPNLSFSYSTSNNKVVDVSNVRIHIDVKLGKALAGECSVNFKNLIADNTKINKKNKFDKELTIQVYEKMIAELAEQINMLKE